MQRRNYDALFCFVHTHTHFYAQSHPNLMLLDPQLRFMLCLLRNIWLSSTAPDHRLTATWIGMSHSTGENMALLPELKRRLSQLPLDTPQAKIPRTEGIASESSASESTGSTASHATACRDTTQPEKAGCTGSTPYSIVDEVPPRRS